LTRSRPAARRRGGRPGTAGPPDQRLIAHLLPGTTTSEPVLYDLDRSSASSSTSSWPSGRSAISPPEGPTARDHLTARALGTPPGAVVGAVFHGRTELDSSRFDGGLSLQGPGSGASGGRRTPRWGRSWICPRRLPRQSASWRCWAGRRSKPPAGAAAAATRATHRRSEPGQPIAEPHAGSDTQTLTFRV